MWTAIIAVCSVLTIVFICVAYLLYGAKKLGRLEDETKQNELRNKRMEEIRKVDNTCRNTSDTTIDGRMRDAAKTNK